MNRWISGAPGEARTPDLMIRSHPKAKNQRLSWRYQDLSHFIRTWLFSPTSASSTRIDVQSWSGLLCSEWAYYWAYNAWTDTDSVCPASLRRYTSACVAFELREHREHRAIRAISVSYNVPAMFPDLREREQFPVDSKWELERSALAAKNQGGTSVLGDLGCGRRSFYLAVGKPSANACRRPCGGGVVPSMGNPRCACKKCDSPLPNGARGLCPKQLHAIINAPNSICVRPLRGIPELNRARSWFVVQEHLKAAVPECST